MLATYIDPRLHGVSLIRSEYLDPHQHPRLCNVTARDQIL